MGGAGSPTTSERKGEQGHQESHFALPVNTFIPSSTALVWQLIEVGTENINKKFLNPKK